MIDHASVYVTDVKKARDLYLAAYGPLGYEVLIQFPSADEPVAVGLGVGGKPDLWVVGGGARTGGQHVAVRAGGRKAVRAFYEAALAAGATDNGPPGPRPHYHANYFGAFVHDFDGNNLEACCHEPYIE